MKLKRHKFDKKKSIKDTDNVDDWLVYFKTKGCDLEAYIGPEDIQHFIKLEKMYNQVKDSTVLEEWKDFYNHLQPSLDSSTTKTLWDIFYRQPNANSEDYQFFKQVKVKVSESITNTCNTICMGFDD